MRDFQILNPYNDVGGGATGILGLFSPQLKNDLH